MKFKKDMTWQDRKKFERLTGIHVVAKESEHPGLLPPDYDNWELLCQLGSMSACVMIARIREPLSKTETPVIEWHHDIMVKAFKEFLASVQTKTKELEKAYLENKQRWLRRRQSSDRLFS